MKQNEMYPAFVSSLHFVLHARKLRVDELPLPPISFLFIQRQHNNKNLKQFLAALPQSLQPCADHWTLARRWSTTELNTHRVNGDWQRQEP